MTDDDPGRVNLTCECGLSHTVVWPGRNPESVNIQCPCDSVLVVHRDASFHKVDCDDD